MFDFVTEKHVYIKQNCYFSPGYKNVVTKTIYSSRKIKKLAAEL